MNVPINELLGFESISKLTPKQTEILYKFSHDISFKNLLLRILMTMKLE